MNKLAYNFIAAATLSVVCMASAVAADNPGFYIGGEVGGSWSTSNQYHNLGDTAFINTFSPGTSISADAGSAPVIGAKIGYRFSDMFRSDIGIDYRWGYKVSTAPAKTANNLTGYTANLNALAAMENFYFEPFTFGGFKPYLGGGFGVAVIKTSSASVVFGTGNTPDPLTGQTQTNFAWQAMAGVSYSLTDQMALDLGYRHLSAGKILVGGNVPLSDSPTTGRLNTNEVLVGARYTF